MGNTTDVNLFTIVRELTYYSMLFCLTLPRGWCGSNQAAGPQQQAAKPPCASKQAAGPSGPSGKVTRGNLPTSKVNDLTLISIIIPAYNEKPHIQRTLDAIFSGVPSDMANIEVLLADGGSSDGTQDIVRRQRNVKVLSCSGGRSGCLRTGTQEAQGEIFLFLHGDTVLPPGYAKQIRDCLKDSSVSCGCFRFKLEPRLPMLSLVEWGTNLRARYLQTPYGDQALFSRSEVYSMLGGFPDQQLMEDVDYVFTCRAAGVVRMLDAPILTSSRRWEINGVFGNTFNNQLVLLGRAVGVPLPRLAQWYYGLTRRKRY